MLANFYPNNAITQFLVSAHITNNNDNNVCVGNTSTQTHSQRETRLSAKSVLENAACG